MTFWTSERDHQLTELWHGSLSAAQIARHMGHKSRNAVLGRAFRLGLPKRVPGNRRGRPRADRDVMVDQVKRGRKARVATRYAAKVTKAKSKFVLSRPGHFPAHLAQSTARARLSAHATIAMRAADDVARVMSILDLEDHHCKWVVGEISRRRIGGYGYCGAERVPGSSYCEGHTARSRWSGNSNGRVEEGGCKPVLETRP